MAKKILILGNAGWSTQELVKEFTNAGANCEVYDPMDLFPFLGESSAGHDRSRGTDAIYFRTKTGEKSERLILKDIDGVVTRLAGRGAHYGRYVTRAFEAKGIFVANIAESISICGDKFYTCQVLKRAFVPTPKQMLLYRSKDPKEALSIVDPKPPLICKKISGSQGKGIFVINDALSGSMVLESFSDSFLVLQRYLNKRSTEKKSDIRAFVIGAESDNPEIISYERISESEDPRSNFSIHHSGKPVELNELEKGYAIDAARCVGAGIAGVDIIRDQDTGRSFVIEVNSNPSLQGITEVTGVNVARKIVTYVLRESARKRPNRPFYDGINAHLTEQQLQPQTIANQNKPVFTNPNLNTMTTNTRQQKDLELLAKVQQDINEIKQLQKAKAEAEAKQLKDFEKKIWQDDKTNAAAKDFFSRAGNLESPEPQEEFDLQKASDNDPVNRFLSGLNKKPSDGKS